MKNPKIMKFFSKSFLILILILIPLVSRPLYAKGKEDAPGQTKKQESADNVNKDSQSQTSKEDKKNSDGNKPGYKFQNDLSDPTVTPGKKRNDEHPKIGAGKLKNILDDIENEGSEAAKKKFGKINRLSFKEATGSSQSKRRAISGVITAIEKGVITLAHIIHRERITTILTDGSTVVHMKGNDAASIADLTVGMRIAVVGDISSSQSGLLAKRIHVIPGKAVGVFDKHPLATPSGNLATPSSTPIVSSTPSATVSPSEIPTVNPTVTPLPTL